jgi:periplasmic divalent cation tolerance protein
MTDEIQFIEIHWTSGSLDEARRISRYLAQERWIASAQIIPWIESIYLLDNRLETAQESKIVFKTRFENYEKIKELIERNCKYQVPEITWFKIAGGSQTYLKWLQESTLLTNELTHVSHQ